MKEDRSYKNITEHALFTPREVSVGDIMRISRGEDCKDNKIRIKPNGISETWSLVLLMGRKSKHLEMRPGAGQPTRICQKLGMGNRKPRRAYELEYPDGRKKSDRTLTGPGKKKVKIL